MGYAQTEAAGAELAPSRNPEATRARSKLQCVLSVQTLVVVLASWTVGYWIAAALHIGWALAVPAAVVVGLVVARTLRPWVDVSVYAPAPGENAQLLVALGMVVAWPLLYDLGSPVLVGGALLALAARFGLSRTQNVPVSSDARLALAVVVFVVVALLANWSWYAALGATICACALAVVRPVWFEAVAARILPGEEGVDPTDRSVADADGQSAQRLLDRPWITTSILAAFGCIIAIWVAGFGGFFNGDNAYHLNKAAHYAQSPVRWEARDYMFGAPGLDHFPYINFLSSYEALLGVSSRLVGLDPWDTMSIVFIPLLCFLTPFAGRHAARGLGVRRAGLAGGLLATVLVISPSVSVSNWVSFSIGKGFGPMVFAAPVVAAAGYLVRKRTPRSAALVVMSVVAFVASSPSHSLSTGILLAGFTAVALWATWFDLGPDSGSGPEPDRRRQSAVVVAPLVFVGLYAIGARLFQGRADPIQQRLAEVFAIDDGFDAWSFAVSAVDGWQPPALVFGAAVALVWCASGPPVVRRSVAAALLALYLLLVPLVFDVVVGDVLGLTATSWRFFAVFFTPLVIGLGAASVDRSRLGLLSTVAIVTAIGLSGPSLAGAGIGLLRPQAPKVWESPRLWPADTGASPALAETVDEFLAATPPGGRFLGPPDVEAAATARTIDRLPTYVRGQFINSFNGDAGTPERFLATERARLGRAVLRPLERSTPAEEFATALRRVDVDTVCLTPRSDDRLREAVEADYRLSSETPLCAVWVRNEGG